ncbi:MutS protein 1 [Coemansia sp. RSA 989]|nr:MutS protein 1 [Coemansia sp. RSA 989]
MQQRISRCGGPAAATKSVHARRLISAHTVIRNCSDASSSKREATEHLTASTSSVLGTVREYRQKYPNCVLLVRVGDFYELYYEQADDVGGHVLGLQVVDKKFKGGSVRFTGFPSHTLLRHMETMVVKHRLSVALCEQFQEPERRSFTRKVTRVVTPGTLIDDECLATTRVHNYILCIYRNNRKLEEYQVAMEKWKQECMRVEKEHCDGKERVHARAACAWKLQSGSTGKRRPGRPRKQQSGASGSVEFDAAGVAMPEPPLLPPQPETSDFMADEGGGLSLAWLDLATGDFMASSGTADALSADLARIRPQEIIVEEEDSSTAQLVESIYPQSLSPTRPLVTKIPTSLFFSQKQPASEQVEDIAAPSDSESRAMSPNAYWPMPAPSPQLVATPEHLLLEAGELSSSELMASRALLNYVMGTQLGLLPPLQSPKRYATEGHMRMGAATIQALELLRPINAERSDSGPSLLSEIDHTRTSAGARLLAKRLVAPSTSIDIVEQRLDLVEFFCSNSRIRERVYEQLENIGDVERAVNKLSLNCGGPHDLLAIASTLREVSRIKRTLREYVASAQAPSQTRLQQPRRRQTTTMKSYSQRSAIIDIVQRKEQALQALSGLVREITAKIRKDAERDVRAFGFLNPDCSPEITRLHTKLSEKENERRALQQKWQTQYSCSSLKLDSIPALGQFIEVSKRESERLASSREFRMIQSLKSKVRFENQQWTYLLSEIEMLRGRIQVEEMREFEELRDRVLAASTAIRTNSRVLADIDVAISMAVLATARQYTRPRLCEQTEAEPHRIAGGRHPVVESQLLAANRQYVSNDCLFSSKDSRVLLLTGPNMGGKSTYLRQIALTSVLAQMGSFVPADDARLHIVDAIYSRIGAHDNLALDQSTFMVEMSETAEILRHATSSSLVILDEIGRGTATADGTAIAYATLKHLHDQVRCKAIFATHYHELVPHVLPPSLPALQPLQTAIYEDQAGGFAFLHKVKPGICTQSHALYVAQIAGIPKEVLALAQAGLDSESESDDEQVLAAAFYSSEDEVVALTTKLSVADALQKRTSDLAHGKAVPVNVTRGVPEHISAAAAHDLELTKAETKSSQRMRQVPGKEKIGMLVRPKQTQRAATPFDVPQTSLTREQVKSYRNAAYQREKYLVDSFESFDFQATEMKPWRSRNSANFGGLGYTHTKDDEKEAIESMLQSLVDVKISNGDVIETPPEMTIVLKPHQREGVTWMVECEKDPKRRGGILGDDMGLGKTIQTLALLMANPPPKNYPTHSTLVVAPTATLSHWKREAETRLRPGTLKTLVYHGPKRQQHSDSLANYDVVITSIGIVASEWAHELHNLLFSFNAADRSLRDQKIMQDEKSSPLFRTRWRRIVVDEAHELKNRAAKRSMACCDLIGEYRWCLSGTPIQNTVEDLYPLLRFLRNEPYCEYHMFKRTEKFLPGQVEIMRAVLENIMLRRCKDILQNTEHSLPRRYYYNHVIDLSPAENILYNYFASKSCREDRWNESTGILALLQLLLRMRQSTSHPSVLLSGKYSSLYIVPGESVYVPSQKYWAQSKDAVRKLPIADESVVEFCGFCEFRQIDFDKVIGVHRCGAFICERCAQNGNDGPCQVCPQQKPTGYDIKPSHKPPNNRQFPGTNESGLLKYLDKASRTAIDMQLVSWLEYNYLRRCSHPTPSSKMKRILAIVQAADQHDKTDKVVVFTEHVHMVELLSNYLTEKGFPNVKYVGSMNLPQRQKVLEDFSTNPQIRVLIISKKAGATGLNLMAANHIIIESLWWNPAIDNQAVDRIYRIGQTKQVHIHILIARNTVDEKVFEIQDRKRRLINAVISDTKAAESVKLSREDILRILKSIYKRIS